MLEWLGVAAGAMVIGGWVIPIGLLLDLSPTSSFLAAYLGAMVGTTTIVLLGGRVRDVMLRRLGPDAEERIREGRAQRLLDRWGVVGLATFGMVVLGPTVTMVAVLVLGVPRGRFLIWASISTLVFFGGLTVFWAAVI